MSDDEWRALLDERFGPLAEVELERRVTPWRVVRRRRRVLVESLCGAS